jgi:hypothetical protein
MASDWSSATSTGEIGHIGHGRHPSRPRKLSLLERCTRSIIYNNYAYSWPARVVVST